MITIYFPKLKNENYLFQSERKESDNSYKDPTDPNPCLDSPRCSRYCLDSPHIVWILLILSSYCPRIVWILLMLSSYSSYSPRILLVLSAYCLDSPHIVLVFLVFSSYCLDSPRCARYCWLDDLRSV